MDGDGEETGGWISPFSFAIVNKSAAEEGELVSSTSRSFNAAHG